MGRELSSYWTSEPVAVHRVVGVERGEEMQFITEAEHVHSSSEDYVQQFEQLKVRLGMDSSFG